MVMVVVVVWCGVGGRHVRQVVVVMYGGLINSQVVVRRWRMGVEFTNRHGREWPPRNRRLNNNLSSHEERNQNVQVVGSERVKGGGWVQGSAANSRSPQRRISRTGQRHPATGPGVQRASNVAAGGVVWWERCKN